MSTRRLAQRQPASFAFTPENLAWAKGQIGKFPEGRQASAVIPLLWRAQEQEGWLSQPAIEEVAKMLDMPFIRALEVATFYFMFKLSPVGSVAHVELCGTTPCMLCGSEALVEVARRKINTKQFELSPDGKFSWEEVECLGACSNAPMIQIGSDYYEDLTPETFEAILEALARGERPTPGPQNGRFASEPEGGATSLTEGERTHHANASIELASGATPAPRLISGGTPGFEPRGAQTVAVMERPAPVAEETAVEAPAEEEGVRPSGIEAPDGGGDDLKMISGVGPKLEGDLKALGVYTFAQIAAWTPAEALWVGSHFGFRGRIEREDWIAQAKVLAAGGETEFSKRVEEDGTYEGDD